MCVKKQDYQQKYNVCTSPPNVGSSVRDSTKIIELEKRTKRLKDDTL